MDLDVKIIMLSSFPLFWHNLWKHYSFSAPETDSQYILYESTHSIENSNKLIEIWIFSHPLLCLHLSNILQHDDEEFNQNWLNQLLSHLFVLNNCIRVYNNFSINNNYGGSYRFIEKDLARNCKVKVLKVVLRSVSLK